MKLLVMVLCLAPLFASAAEPAKKFTNCRFSRKAKLHNEITNRGCAAKSCLHTVVCGDDVKSVVCKSKSGGNCDANDANDCMNASLTEDAEFDTAPRAK